MQHHCKNSGKPISHSTAKNSPVSNFFCQENLTKKLKRIYKYNNLILTQMAEQKTGLEHQDQIDVLKAELQATPAREKGKIREIVTMLVALVGIAGMSSAIAPHSTQAQEPSKETKVAQVVPVIAIPGVNLDQMVMDTERDTNEAIAEARARRIAAEARADAAEADRDATIARAREATALAKRMAR